MHHFVELLGNIVVLIRGNYWICSSYFFIETVTHDVAQYFNEMICPYVNSKYMVKSSDEFLLKINDLVMTPAQKVVSRDVSSLFTNVPIDRTLDIIREQAFLYPSIPPPVLPEDDLRNL